MRFFADLLARIFCGEAKQHFGELFHKLWFENDVSTGNINLPARAYCLMMKTICLIFKSMVRINEYAITYRPLGYGLAQYCHIGNH